MSSKKVCCVCALLSLLAGCASGSPIDEKKKKAQTTQISINKNVLQQLTDEDLYGNETTLAISEEDIQTALEGDEFRVPLNPPAILVQSDSRAPETTMQEEMRKYYTVATLSGIPDRKKTVTCNKNKNKDENLDIVDVENTNWVQALRFVAVRGHQKATTVLQDTLQTGKHDSGLESIVWTDYKSQKLADTMSLRHLVRFVLMDVATSEWATWSPVNYESKAIFPQVGNKNSDSFDVAEQWVSQLERKMCAAVVRDLVSRYQQ